MIRKLAIRVSQASRKKKFRLFMDIMSPTPYDSILDVGVTDSGYGQNKSWPTENFFDAFYPWPERITAVGLHNVSRFKAAYPSVTCVTADGRRLPFRDKEFNIALSNAVVEHVGGVEDQIKFINELCRVAKKVFVTTPNKWFPFEAHTLLPLFHWLPEAQWKRVVRVLG